MLLESLSADSKLRGQLNQLLNLCEIAGKRSIIYLSCAQLVDLNTCYIIIFILEIGTANMTLYSVIVGAVQIPYIVIIVECEKNIREYGEEGV